MTVRTVRKIVTINEELCNGCGACVPRCAEGALKIVDGKARLVSEVYCDGLGACLGECPVGAITVEERVAEEFDEEAVKEHLAHEEHEVDTLPCGCPSATVTEFEKPEIPVGGCPSARIIDLQTQTEEGVEAPAAQQPSTLRHWPVQLTLVPPRAPFLKDADVLLAAHCAAFAYGSFHQDFLKDRALLIACPKLDDVDAHYKKLVQIVAHSGLKSLTVAHMEVPCCSGLVYLAQKAVEDSGKDIPLNEVTIGVRGDLKS
ncbi:MAG: 4Fe-4S binding protein [Dehalococcoidia bacterium]|nr:4Fe-4S binding protein [Dehalococcoidia bacterium]